MNLTNVASVVSLLALAKSRDFSEYLKSNAPTQLALFSVTANLPSLLTGRMSYVDIAWPWGLVAIGLRAKVAQHKKKEQTKLLSRGNFVSFALLLAGLRMGLGALMLAKSGHLNEELPRYLFQRRRWAKRGITREASPILYILTMQAEILVQALANIGALSIPVLLCTFSKLKAKPFNLLEKFSAALWAFSLVMEHVADTQKNSFLVACKAKGIKNQTCNVGLWKYSRHPNYFFEWCVWVALTLFSLPSLAAFWSSNEEKKETNFVKLGVTIGWLAVPFFMYQCLVYYTGAVPAEYYSVQKRPEYKLYQAATNMFFPGPTK